MIANGCSREDIFKLVTPEEDTSGVLLRITDIVQEQDSLNQNVGRRSETGLIEDVLRSLEDLNKILMNKPDEVRRNRLANVKTSIDRVFRIFGVDEGEDLQGGMLSRSEFDARM
jgi:hypothetical protein